MANSLASRRRLRSETISPTTSTLTPWRRSMRVWPSMSPAATASSATLDGAVDAGGDELRIAGQEAQEVDVLEQCRHIRRPRPPRRGACCAWSFAAAPSRRSRSGATETTSYWASPATLVSIGRRLRIAAFDRSVPVTMPTRSPSRTNRALALTSRILRAARSIESEASMNVARCNGRSRTRACSSGLSARALLFARRRVELARDVAIEERGEARVVVDQPQRDVARQQVAQRLLAGDEGVRAAALDERRGCRSSRRDRAARRAPRRRALRRSP